MRVASSVRGSSLTADSVALQSGVGEAVGTGGKTSVRVEIANPTDSPLMRASFVVAALDDESLPVARWRVTWPWPIAPRQQIAFTADTPVNPGSEVHHWDVVGVGTMADNNRDPDTSTADLSS
jgi:hypothetical protein